MSRVAKKDTLNELESKINSLERSDFDLKLRLHYLNTKYGHLENSDSRHGEFDLRDKIQALSEENEYYKQKIVELETEVLRLQVAREKEMEKYQEALRMNPAAAHQVEERRKQEQEVSLAIAEHDTALIAKLQDELQQLHIERAGHQMIASELNDKISKLVRLADAKDAEIDSLVRTVRDMRVKIDSLSQEQQKIANLAEAVTRPIHVTTNTSEHQTLVTLNAAGTNINASTVNATSNSNALTVRTQFNAFPTHFAQSHTSLGNVSSSAVRPSQFIAVTQQNSGGGSTAVNVTATPARSAVYKTGNQSTTAVTVSSNSNPPLSSGLNSSAAPSSQAMPLGVNRGASSTAGMQHTLQYINPNPYQISFHNSKNQPFQQQDSQDPDEMLHQSLHASALMNNDSIIFTNNHPLEVSFISPPMLNADPIPQSVTFVSTMPDGSPVRTIVTASTSANSNNYETVNSTMGQPLPMRQQFQQSIQQSSLDNSMINQVGFAQNPIHSQVNVTTTGENVNTVYIQQQPLPPTIYGQSQSQMDILQQSILTTEQVIQQLRQNAHELSLLDQNEVHRLEHKLQQTEREKEQLLLANAKPPQPGSIPHPPPPQQAERSVLYGVPSIASLPLRPSGLEHSTSFLPRSSSDVSRFHHRGVDGYQSAYPGTASSYLAHPGAPATSSTTSVSIFTSPSPGAAESSTTTVHVKSPQYTNPSAYTSGTGRQAFAAATAAVNAHNPQENYHSKNGDFSSRSPFIMRPGNYLNSLNGANYVNDDYDSPNGKHGTAVYERTIDFYKMRENELLSALEGVVKRAQELEEVGDLPAHRHHAKQHSRSHHHHGASQFHHHHDNHHRARSSRSRSQTSYVDDDGSVSENSEISRLHHHHHNSRTTSHPSSSPSQHHHPRNQGHSSRDHHEHVVHKHSYDHSGPAHSSHRGSRHHHTHRAGDSSSGNGHSTHGTSIRSHAHSSSRR
jgi:hypothetical protein